MRNLVPILGLLFAMPARGDENPYAYKAAEHTMQRAGYPGELNNVARLSPGKHDKPGYIGGGRPFIGESRGPADGTFGWDYVARPKLMQRIFMGWSHDRTHQPSFGNYNPERLNLPHDGKGK